MSYSLEEEKEMNAELKQWQNKLKRLINSDKWDSVSERLSNIHMSTITKVMNANSHKDINWLVWRNVDVTIERVRELMKQVK